MPQLFCNMCGSEDTQSCAGCKETRYCSKDCQTKDWHTHRLLCRQYSSKFSDKDRPEPEFRRFIFFPEDQLKPEFVWLSTEGSASTLVIASLLNCNTIFLNSESTSIHPARETTPVPHTIILQSKKPPPEDSTANTPFNQSILHTLYPNLPGKPPYSSLLCSAISSSGDPLDLAPSDLPTILYHLLTSGADPITGLSSIPTVPGVKITCRGDQLRCSEPAYMPVQIPITHPIFTPAPTNAPTSSPILSRLDLPLLVHRYPKSPKWASEEFIQGMGSANNQPATYLHLDIDPGSTFFGFAPMEWQNDVGSILVVREDRIGITPEQVRVLCEFCQYHVSELCAKHSGVYGDEGRIGAEEVANGVNKGALREWFERWKVETDGGVGWEGLKVPYDDVHEDDDEMVDL